MNGINANKGDVGGWTITPAGLSCSGTGSDGATYSIQLNPATYPGGSVLSVYRNGERIFGLGIPNESGTPGKELYDLSVTGLYTEYLNFYRVKTRVIGGKEYSGVNTQFFIDDDYGGMWITVKNGLIVGAGSSPLN